MDGGFGQAQTLGEPLCEGCLAGAEAADQAKDIAREQERAERGGGGACRGFGWQLMREGAHWAK